MHVFLMSLEQDQDHAVDLQITALGTDKDGRGLLSAVQAEYLQIVSHQSLKKESQNAACWATALVFFGNERKFCPFFLFTRFFRV